MLPGFLHLWDSIIKRWISFLDNRIIWCWGQIVHLNILIDKLHKAVSVLFRCTKIRKSKPAWVRFSQSDVNGNNESSMTRCCLVLPSVAEHHCVSTDTLRFSNFLPKSQNYFGFAQDASRQVMNTIWVGSSSQNWGRRCEFLIFAQMEICLKC